MEKRPTLAEMFASVKEDLGKVENNPLAFTTRMFAKEMGLSKTQSLTRLNELENEGKIKRVKYCIKNKNGVNQTIDGWQWLVD